MINLCLYGGLGNQIFQLATAILFANKKNINKINIDISIIDNFDAKFGLQLKEFFSLENLNIEITFKNYLFTNLRLPKIKPIRMISNGVFISDDNFQSIFHNRSKKNHYYFDGYFQECLTQENLDEMIRLLKPLLNVKFKNIEDSNKSVVIHIRGGDFVKLNRNPTLDKNFYLNAIKNFSNIKKIKIVTDDIVYSESIFTDASYDFDIVSSNTLDDFITIGSYSNRILSPSTFSFWASALGSNKVNSSVYAWKYWHDLVPRAIKLPNEQE